MSDQAARVTAVPSMSVPGHLDTALADVELVIRRRLDGLLQGNHLGLVPGPGREAGDARPYVPGDDVRRMDWAVTARTTVPHIRETVADRELETWLAVDLSASMDFGTARCEKRDLAVVACAAVAHLTAGGGNRLGAVVASGSGTERLAARGGRSATHHLLRQIATTPRSSPGDRGDVAAMLEQLRRPPRRRGLVVVISDFLGPLSWERPLRALAGRHDVIAIEVRDPRDARLPDVGMVTLTDPESGRSKQVRTTAGLRDRFATVADERQDEVTRALRRAGVPSFVLATDRDWIGDIVRFVMRRKRAWSGNAAGGSQRAAHHGSAQ